MFVLYQFCAEADLGEESALTGGAQQSWPAVRPAAICLTYLPELLHGALPGLAKPLLFVALVTVSLHQGSARPLGRERQRGFSVTTHLSFRCSITIQKPLSSG